METPDFDTSVPEGWGQAASPGHCQNHPDSAATMVCGQCAALLCDRCTKPRKVGKARVNFCGVCGGMCRGLVSGQRETGARTATSFGSELGRAFAYPFKGNGTMMIAGATVLYAVAAIVPGGFLLGMVLAGYMAAFLMSVIATSSQGAESPPPWPDYSNAWDDIVRPLLMIFGTIAISLGPAWLVRYYLGIKEVDAPWVYPIVLLGGLLYLPMGLLAVAMLDTMAALDPRLVIPSILRVPGAYLVVCAIFFGTFAASSLGDSWLFERVRLLSLTLGQFLAIFSLLRREKMRFCFAKLEPIRSISEYRP